MIFLLLPRRRGREPGLQEIRKDRANLIHSRWVLTRVVINTKERLDILSVFDQVQFVPRILRLLQLNEGVCRGGDDKVVLVEVCDDLAEGWGLGVEREDLTA